MIWACGGKRKARDIIDLKLKEIKKGKLWNFVDEGRREARRREKNRQREGEWKFGGRRLREKYLGRGRRETTGA